jgi:SpoVK/Ycf46/Vps4 family AAA+-type ATPase
LGLPQKKKKKRKKRKKKEKKRKSFFKQKSKIKNQKSKIKQMAVTIRQIVLTVVAVVVAMVCQAVSEAIVARFAHASRAECARITTGTEPRIIGQRDARRQLYRAVIAPLLARGSKKKESVHPLLRVCNGALMYGPPGTGKTLLARWTAARMGETGGSFFAAGPASLQDKYYGETPKIITALFASAKMHEPSVVFIDEIDGLLGTRGFADHAPARELKTVMLTELSSLEHAEPPPRVVFLGATNRKTDIDPAILRRMRVHIPVPLPTARDRERAVATLLDKPVEDYRGWFGDITHGASLADIRETAKHAVAIANERDDDGGNSVSVADVRLAVAAILYSDHGAK